MTKARLCSVNRIRNCSIPANILPPNTQVLLTTCADSIIMRPLIQSPFPEISTISYTAVMSYATELFAGNYRKIKRFLDEAMENMSTLADREDVLLMPIEQLIKDYRHNTGISTACKLKGKTGCTSSRRAQWHQIWSDVVNTWKYWIRTTVRYKGAHGYVLPMGNIFKDAGFMANMPVAIEEREDGTYLIRRAEDKELDMLTKISPITREGIVHGKRYLYLTKRQKEALGIGSELYKTGVDMKFTIDMVDKHVIVVEPLTKEEAETLPTLGQVTAIAGSTRKSSKPYQSTIVCQRHLSGPIILPNIFCTKYDIQKNDTLRTELHDGKLYIYGRPHCDVCNSTDPKETVTVSICGECANVEEDVRKTIESCGNVPNAVLASKAALQAAMDKLAAYEGRI